MGCGATQDMQSRPAAPGAGTSLLGGLQTDSGRGRVRLGSQLEAKGGGWGGEPSPLELKISTPFPLVAHLLEILYPARE